MASSTSGKDKSLKLSIVIIIFLVIALIAAITSRKPVATPSQAIPSSTQTQNQYPSTPSASQPTSAPDNQPSYYQNSTTCNPSTLGGMDCTTDTANGSQLTHCTDNHLGGYDCN